MVLYPRDRGYFLVIDNSVPWKIYLHSKIKFFSFYYFNTQFDKIWVSGAVKNGTVLIIDLMWKRPGHVACRNHAHGFNP